MATKDSKGPGFFSRMWGRRDSNKDLFSTGYNQVLGMGPKAHGPQTFNELSVEGFEKNAIVNRAVREVAQGAASVPFKVYRYDETGEKENAIEVMVHPLITLLNRPFPTRSRNEFFSLLYTILELAGEVFILNLAAGDTKVSAQPKALRILESGRVTLEHNKTTGMPLRWRYQTDGEPIYYPIDAQGRSAIKQIKNVNPLNHDKGLSNFAAVGPQIKLYNNILRHTNALIENGGKPDILVSYNNLDKNNMPAEVSKAQSDNMNKSWNEKFSGPDQAGKTAFIGKDAKVQKLSMTPDEMGFERAANLAAKDIALVAGVPTQLMGIPDAQTYSNYAEARLALYQEKIMPLAQIVLDELNEWLIPQFGASGRGLRIEYDFDKVPAMAEQRRRVIENNRGMVQDSIASPAEARENIGGFKPLKNGVGDEPIAKGDMFPLSMIGNSAPPASENDNTGDDDDSGEEN